MFAPSRFVPGVTQRSAIQLHSHVRRTLGEGFTSRREAILLETLASKSMGKWTFEDGKITKRTDFREVSIIQLFLVVKKQVLEEAVVSCRRCFCQKQHDLVSSDDIIIAVRFRGQDPVVVWNAFLIS